jgi:hypothetical protein
MKDFAIQVTHRPGEIAHVGNALAKQEVNIKSIAGISIGNQGMFHIIPDDVAAARAALQASNIRFEEYEVVTVLLENRTGELAGLGAKLVEAGVNVLAVFVIGLEGELVELAVVADDPKKAKKALEG